MASTAAADSCGVAPAVSRRSLLTQVPASELDQAMGVLYKDAMEIYERARREVTIPRSDGRRQAYAAVRYKQQIEGVKDNKSMLVTVIANIIKKRTSGFDHLAEANRPDLMVENLVLDKTKPYHRFFTQNTRNVAQQRMSEFYGRNGSYVSGLTKRLPHRSRGSIRANAARNIRSAGRQFGRTTCRRSTASS